MKQFYLTIAAGLFAGAVFAQQAIAPGDLIPVEVPSKKELAGQTKAVNSYYIDYEAADEDLFFNYQTFIRWINGGITTNGNMEYIVTTFDTLYITPDYTTFTSLDYNEVTKIVVDSIFFRIHHQNNTGTPNTLDISIVELGPVGSTANTSYRPTTNILWDTTITTTTSLTNAPTTPGSYPTAIIGIESGFELPPANERFGVMMEFNGGATDSLAIIFGFPHDPNTPCGAATTYGQVIPSFFYPSAFYNAFNSNATNGKQLYPTTNGGGYWYYDCNGSTTAQWPDENPYQNWSLWVRTTITDNVSVGEHNSDILTLSSSPNPANGNVSVNYSLQNASDVNIRFYDITGKEVIAVNESIKIAGKHATQVDVSSLPAGLYYYTLQAGNSRLSNKLVVVK